MFRLAITQDFDTDRGFALKMADGDVTKSLRSLDPAFTLIRGTAKSGCEIEPPVICKHSPEGVEVSNDYVSTVCVGNIMPCYEDGSGTTPLTVPTKCSLLSVAFDV